MSEAQRLVFMDRKNDMKLFRNIASIFLCAFLIACHSKNVLAENNQNSDQAIIQQGVELYKKREYEKAYKLLLPIAQQGDAKAQYYAGAAVSLIDLFTLEESEAIHDKLLEKSAAQNYPKALFNVAWKDINSAEYHKVKTDLSRAMRYLTQAAEANNIEAQTRLAWKYMTGMDGKYDRLFNKNEKEAVKWYLRAANQGDGNSANSLMEAYRDGKGVEKNLEEAMFWCIVYLDAMPVRYYGTNSWADAGKSCGRTVVRKLTKNQIIHARKRADAWHYNPIDEDLKEELQQEEEMRKQRGVDMKSSFRNPEAINTKKQ